MALPEQETLTNQWMQGLMARQQAFQQLLPLFYIDVGQCITEISQPLLALLGQRRTELVGAALNQLPYLPQEQLAEALTQLQAGVDVQQRWSLRLQGLVQEFHLSATPLWGRSGEYAGALFCLAPLPPADPISAPTPPGDQAAPAQPPASNQELEDLRQAHEQLNTQYADLQRRQQEEDDEVRDSIKYASRLQNAIVPREQKLNQTLPAAYQASVYYSPRDVVSGDFYWIGSWKKRTVLLVGDGTGHGVPGALMGLLGINAVSKLVERGITEPAVLLEEADEVILRTLTQEGESLQDSCEMVVVTMEQNSRRITLGSAMRPVYCWKEGRLTKLEPTRHHVGGATTDFADKAFDNQVLHMEDNECLYIFSDGLTDQFGLRNGKTRKWGRKAVEELLTEISNYPFAQRMPALQEALKQHQADEPQTDDIVVLMLEYMGEGGEFRMSY